MSQEDILEPIEREVTEMENTRVLTMMTAIFLKSRFPELTVVEIFEKLKDEVFVVNVLKGLMEEET